MNEKKIAIIYYSRVGHTEEVAKELSERIGGKLVPLEDNKRRTGVLYYLGAGFGALFNVRTTIQPVRCDLDSYDTIVFGGPVWSWNMTPAARAFVEEYKHRLQDKELVFFTTSASTPPKRIVRKMEKLGAFKASGMAGFVEGDFTPAKKDVLADKIDRLAELVLGKDG
jgi:flavodoxin